MNLRKNEVYNLLNDEEMLNIIFNYREFINVNNVQLIMDFQKFNSKYSKISTRVKAKNSIEDKITRYTKNSEHGYGRIQINKCLNDLFGIRIVMEYEVKFEQILKHIEENYDNLKCRDASNRGYKAINIYFKQDNFSFPWELQIWNKQDEINNIISHEKYKQDYVKWEKENKGGNI
ncbi:MAG: hypothetical protein HFJ50_04830 [Clostridia bacterium]|nr:hypothetical protein [Clostridia bacterium]